MSDQKDIARRFLAEHAILNQLQEAHEDTRNEARAAFESGDAAAATFDDFKLGRLRRNKETKTWKVVDWHALEAWVRETVPTMWVSLPQIHPAFRKELLKNGEWVDPDGVVHEVPGLGYEVKEGAVVPELTDEAEAWAAELVGLQLKELE